MPAFSSASVQYDLLDSQWGFYLVFSIVTFNSLLAIALIWWRLAWGFTLLVLINSDILVLCNILSLLLMINFNMEFLIIIGLVLLINLYLYCISNFNNNAVVNIFRLLSRLLFRLRGILWITPLIQNVRHEILRILNKMFCVSNIALLSTLVVAFELLTHHKR